MELYARVRRACMVEGMSTREAARVFGLHRDTVRKMLQYSVPPGYRRESPPRRPKLDPYRGVIDRILEDDRSLPKKQRHTAKRIYERLRAEHGFTGKYTPLGPGVCLDTALCFRHSRRAARDNTVKYRWRTLQLLPGTERRSYAGAVVDVLEGLDGQLAVRYRGEIIPSQEAPPRPGILRSFNGSSSHGTPPRPDLNGLSRRWEAALAALGAQMDAGEMLTTRPSTTAPLESARHLPCSAGSPLHSLSSNPT